MKKFDLVVIGGGLAGVCAAIAAARLGCKVALVQDRPVLGGNSSGEIRVPVGGASSFNPWARETGIMEEIFLEERKKNFVSIGSSQTNSLWDLILYDKCRKEENLTLFLNTSVRDVKMKGKRIVGVKCAQLGTEKELVIKGNLFVDATGDGVVAYSAKAKFRYGREEKKEFNESLAPKKSDQGIMGNSLMFAVKELGHPVPFTPPNGQKSILKTASR